VSDRLATSLGPRSDPSVDMRPDAQRKCLGCGLLHGSVNLQRLCVERALTDARRELATTQAELVAAKTEIEILAAIKQLRAEVAKLPPSWVVKNEIER
jgi:hypothetical protein